MFVTSIALALSMSTSPVTSHDGVVYEGTSGPGKGKHIVFLAGDEEYRSEEGLPQLARILSYRHGFKCTVLFSVNSKGEIDPDTKDNEPGLEALDSADLCVMLLRFRQWPDEQMSHFVNYYLADKPIIGLRTSTHAFDYEKDSHSPYKKFGWQSQEWPGGFGRQVLGESWVSHWGVHGSQATRGLISPQGEKHPVLRGVKDLFWTTDVYEASPPPWAEVLVHGVVVAGMNETDPPASGRKKRASGSEQELNYPLMPIVWTTEHVSASGKISKILTCTMGAATDLLNEGLRRLLVNGAFWAVGLEKKITKNLRVDFVGHFEPSKFGFEGFKKGVKPVDLEGRG